MNQDGYVKATKKTDGQTEDKKGEREKQEDVQKDRRRKKFKWTICESSVEEGLTRAERQKRNRLKQDWGEDDNIDCNSDQQQERQEEWAVSWSSK